MKVALVTTGHEVLGVEYLSAVLKKNGHEVKLFFDPQTFGGSLFLKIDFLRRKYDLLEEVVAGVIDYQPDIIGFSCMTHNFHWCLSAAEKIRKRQNIPVIFGGIHPTSAPESVLSNDCVDMVAIGEGELSLLELLDSMKHTHSTEIKGIFFKENGNIIRNPPNPLIKDLDSLPFPDKQLFYDKIPAFQHTYTIMTARGCPFSCTYCCNDLLKKIYKGQHFVRHRSVDNVMEELRIAKNKYKLHHVYISDEVFSINVRWLKEFSKKYKKEIGLPFTAYYHFKFATEERIKLLTSAGCRRMIFGMQSTSEQIRSEVCNRHYSNEEAKKALTLCKKYNVIVFCDHIFGLPFEEEDSWAEAVEFYRDVSPSIVYSYFLTYFPGTSIVEKGKEAGVLKDEDIKLISNGQQSFLHKSSATKDQNTVLTYQLLYDLVPLLPKSVHKWITDQKWILKIFPKGYIPHFVYNFIARIKAGDPILRRIFLSLSKKQIP